MMFTSNKEYAAFAIVFGVIGFSLKSIFIKLAWNDGIYPIELMGYRMLLSIPFFLFAWCYFRNNEQRKDSNSSIKAIIGCSLLYYVSSLADIIGLTMVSVNIERMILFTIPIFVLIISSLVMKKRYHIGVYLSALFSSFGVAIAYYGEMHHQEEKMSLLGLCLIFISAITFACYYIISAEEMKKRGVIVFNAQVMTLSCLLSLIPLIANINNIEIATFDYQQLRYPFLLAITSTVIPSFLMMYGVKHCGAATVAIINNIGPFFTMGCSYWILHQAISIQDIVGMTIVLVSILYLNKLKTRVKE